ncbi:MAG: cobalamin-dependent protein [Clostridiales Family XIII bacterium]|jgi:methanogenic corrinoid protein MtbC1|nr:cobalamin-dependent protein [Clostridiales Family XIII bacterium]
MIDTAVLKQKLGDLDEDGVQALLDEFAAGTPSAEETQQVVEACQQGMEIVGENFEAGTYFVGDLMYAAQILTAALEQLKPLMSAGGGQAAKGTVVLGTVAGDIHDIGKNIFKALLEAAGFSVIDIGIDQAPSAFVETAKTNGAEIVALSGVLTLSIASMKETIEALAAAGLRDKVKVMIGGNAVSAETCEFIGADYWSKNAAAAVKQGLTYVS